MIPVLLTNACRVSSFERKRFAEEGDVGFRVEVFGGGDCGGAFRGIVCAHADVSTVFCRTGYGVVASAYLWSVIHSTESRETNIPAFPPVTMYTFPERSGRESEWKGILKFSAEEKKTRKEILDRYEKKDSINGAIGAQPAGFRHFMNFQGLPSGENFRRDASCPRAYSGYVCGRTDIDSDSLEHGD